MVLGSLVEAFERFIKETAVVCVDAIAPFTIDNRFDQFSPTGGSLGPAVQRRVDRQGDVRVGHVAEQSSD